MEVRRGKREGIAAVDTAKIVDARFDETMADLGGDGIEEKRHWTNLTLSCLTWRVGNCTVNHTSSRSRWETISSHSSVGSAGTLSWLVGRSEFKILYEESNVVNGIVRRRSSRVNCRNVFQAHNEIMGR